MICDRCDVPMARVRISPSTGKVLWKCRICGNTKEEVKPVGKKIDNNRKCKGCG